MPSPSLTTKLPRSILKGIFAFPPNRYTNGGTSYFILDKSGNILLDCPAWNDINRQFLLDRGGVSQMFITHRGGIGKHVAQIQEKLGCEVIIQEQEAYLLPEVKLTIFQRELFLNSNCYCFWTPGHSPGSSCLYSREIGGVLFSGRHLLPTSPEEIEPMRTAKTFHWPRQLRSVRAISNRFTVETLHYICPGANTGFLRGKGFIDRAYERLKELNLEALQ
ncbi:MAG: MBL fold metallo-hydrolase [Prochloraceae cyanobacterium]|nr:MBL fold metallo-hydrolase [Prochloraceae cyanobacterium]